MDKYRLILLIDGKPLEIPVLPEKITVKRSANSAEKTVLELGNVNLLNGAKLRQISFDSFFPSVYIPSVNVAGSQLKEPMNYVRAINSCMLSKKPLRFILIGADLDINILMSVESFEYTESYGDVGTLTYKLSLKEWVEYSPRRVTISGGKAVSGQAKRSGSPENAPSGNAKSYTVKRGDCMWAICKAMYDDGSLYHKLYLANKANMDERNKGTGYPIYTIYAGQVLTLPPKEEL